MPVIRNRDPLNHLNCRKQQVLAVVASRCAWMDLLMYCALTPTRDIFRHCYIDGGYRWSYRAGYGEDEALRALGFAVTRAGRVSFTEMRRQLPRYLGQGDPVMFHAPRGYFPHWVEFMRRHDTLATEWFDLHSFMVCGETPDGNRLVIMDNTTASHEFEPYEISWSSIEEYYNHDPDRWFTDCLILEHSAQPPDHSWFADRYREYITALDDDFEIYHVISERLAGEREQYRETYRVPSINSLALLAGGRTYFARFLRHTGHEAALVKAFQRNAALLSRLLGQATSFHAAGPAHTQQLTLIRRQLQQLRSDERRTLAMLRKDLRTMREIFPATGPKTQAHLTAASF